jgi:1,4-dihydroxy-2-naphthoyl-CoA hydrolase
MITHETSVKLHHTDAAGLLFFGHQFHLAHDAYEQLMEEIGFSFAHIIAETSFLVAIVRAEADFTAQLYVGDRLTIQVMVEKLGETSYTLAYDLVQPERGPVGSVRTVHVCIDKKTRQKRQLPNDLRRALEKHT